MGFEVHVAALLMPLVYLCLLNEAPYGRDHWESRKRQQAVIATHEKGPRTCRFGGPCSRSRYWLLKSLGWGVDCAVRVMRPEVSSQLLIFLASATRSSVVLA